MIELNGDQLMFSFPGIHPDARLLLEFQRTLRIPGGENEMPRLPSLGRYPLYAVSDHADRVPRHWLDTGGAMLPMYQSEAMWLSLRPAYSVAHQAFYPFAVKIRVGGLDAVRGKRWTEGVHQWPQDFLVVTEHCWLGGYHNGGRGVQQFVAMPLGSGYLPDDGDRSPNRFGCLEIVVYPMRGGAFAMRYPRNGWTKRPPLGPVVSTSELAGDREYGAEHEALQRQQVEEGLFPIGDWESESSRRYSLHLANSLHWCAITGSPPPMAPARVRVGESAASLETPRLRSESTSDYQPPDSLGS